MKKRDINKRTLFLLIGAATIFRLFLAYTQYATITPPLAPIDDHFMFRAAQSISSGQWLGEYNYLTLSKHAFFSIWLAFLNMLNIPYLVGNAGLWAVASGVFTLAISKTIKKKYLIFILYAALLYNPAVWAQFSTRIYRDSIFPALCLIVFSGIIGIGLNYNKSIKVMCLYSLLCGFAMGSVYLSREDGIWILPFVIVATAVIIYLIIKKTDTFKLTRALIMILPFVIAGGVIFSYARLNFKHYGRFIVSDFTSKDFTDAYGALTSIEHESWHPLISVPKDVREKLYNEVELFAPMESALEEPILKNGYYNKVLDDFQSGGFYWAFRTAAQNLGIYDTPQKAQSYYEALTNEIDVAVKEGRLSAKKLRSSVTSPIRLEYVVPVIIEGINGFKTVVTFQQCSPLATKAVGLPLEIQEVEEYIHQKGATVLREGLDIAYLSPVRAITHNFMEFMNFVYKIAIPFMLIISALWQVKRLIADIDDKKFTDESMLNLVMLGMLGMAILRCFMIGFVEVSAFNIGTYAMYLSTVHPLIIAYSALGFCKTFEE